MTKNPVGAWLCTDCGTFEHVEREVVCWTCGEGEMVYIVNLAQAAKYFKLITSEEYPAGADTFLKARKPVIRGACWLCGNYPCPYGDCDK